MLALLLLIGVVVDDAIVVLENIFRHREDLDPDPVSAAINGSNEVVFAVIAATLSLVCIFAPVIFLGGIVGQFFKSFAVVVTFGVLVSLFVSLTLTPMLCSRYLKVAKQHGRLYYTLERVFAGLDRGYRRLLDDVARSPLAGGADHRAGRAVDRLVLPDASARRSPPTRTRGASSSTCARRSAPASTTPTNACARWRRSCKRTRRSSRSSRRSASAMPDRSTRASWWCAWRRGKHAPSASRRRLPCCAASLPRFRARCIFAAPYPIVRRTARRAAAVRAGRDRSSQEVGRLANEMQQRSPAEPGLGRMDLDLQLDLPQITLQPDRTRIADAGLIDPGRRARRQHADRRRWTSPSTTTSRATASATTSG